MLDDLVLQQVREVEGGAVAGGGGFEPGCADEADRRLVDAVTQEGAVHQGVEVDVSAVAGEEAVVGEGVETGAGRAGVVCRGRLVGVDGLVQRLGAHI